MRRAIGVSKALGLLDSIDPVKMQQNMDAR